MNPLASVDDYAPRAESAVHTVTHSSLKRSLALPRSPTPLLKNTFVLNQVKRKFQDVLEHMQTKCYNHCMLETALPSAQCTYKTAITSEKSVYTQNCSNQ